MVGGGFTATEFKPYKYEGCIIYSPKNKAFLEGLATALDHYPQSEKDKMHGRSIVTGGINYLVLLRGKKVILVSKSQRKNNPRGATIFLAEE